MFGLGKYSKICGFLVGAVTFLLVGVFAPLPFAARYSFAFVLLSVICLVFNLAPNWFVSLGVIMVPPTLFGLVPASVSFRSTTDPVWWMLIAAFILGVAFQKSGLGKRIAYTLLRTTAVGWTSAIASVYLLQIIFNITVPFSATAAIIIVLMICEEMIKSLGFEPKGEASTGLALATVTGNSAAGMIVLTGWAVNPLIISGAATAGVELTWGNWLLYVGPLGLMWTLLCLILNCVTIKPERPFKPDKEFFKNKLAELGPVSSTEKKTLVFTFTILLGFITGPLHGLNPLWLATLISFLMFLPRIGVLAPDDFWHGVNWPFIFFMLGLYSIGNILTYQKVGEWLAQVTLPVGVETWNPVAANVYMAGLLVGLHFLVGTMVPLVAVFVPSFASYAIQHGMPAIPVIFSVVWAAKRWVFYFQEATVAMTYGFGFLSAKRTMKFGLILTAAILLLMVPISTFYWMAIGLYSHR